MSRARIGAGTARKASSNKSKRISTGSKNQTHCAPGAPSKTANLIVYQSNGKHYAVGDDVTLFGSGLKMFDRKERSDIGKHIPLAHNPTPQDAYNKGYRFVIVSPKGHPVSFHRDEGTAKWGLQVVKGMGCVLKPLESIL